MGRLEKSANSAEVQQEKERFRLHSLKPSYMEQHSSVDTYGYLYRDIHTHICGAKHVCGVTLEDKSKICVETLERRTVDTHKQGGSSVHAGKERGYIQYSE